MSVPLDRRDPSRASVSLFFEVYPHTAVSSPLPPVFVTEGGPGFSATQGGLAGFYSQVLFAPLRDRHDIVLLDQRGVGLSDALDCPDAQHGVGDVYAQVAACGAQLGAAAALYGSDDVVRDIDQVRKALGYHKIDFYGGSNAAVDIQAYAARFRDHLHAAVLDSPVLALGHDTFFPFDPAQIKRTVRLICARSVSCSADHHNGGQDLAWLAARLRTHPLDGTARDASGVVHTVHLTEAFLATHIGYSSGGIYAALAELPAAARSLRRGDPAPLLRIAAENDFPIIGDSGDPTEFSAGENLARYCTDNTFHWNKAASVATRRAQFARAAAALPKHAFAPFSVDGWLAPPPDGFQPDPCIAWPAPDRSIVPPVPAGARFPHIPALVLAGDLDRQVAKPEAERVAALFPQSTFIELHNSGHHTAVADQYQCADALIQRFLATLATGDASCAHATESGVPAPGRFPRRTRDAVPASATADSDRTSPRRDRQVAAVASATVTDAYRRVEQDFADGVGLRGGTFATSFGDNAILVSFSKTRFASDLAVTGEASLTFGDSTVLDATVTVRGARTGRLHITGVWSGHGATVLTIDGRVGVRPIHVTVPAT
jgi:pimeloyl-ACP methyl ester carboxylesterase